MEEVKDKGAIFLSMDNVDHEIVEAMEEQGKTTIEDFDMVSYETDRPTNLIVMPISEKINWIIGKQIKCSSGLTRRSVHLSSSH